MNGSIIINKRVKIPLDELRFRYARSGGHGGQNVNKVETRVELIFDVHGSRSLSDNDRRQLSAHLSQRIDSRGMLHIVSQESRSQWRNRELAVVRFTELLKKALMPRKKRIATKTPVALKERRLENKKRRGDIKKSRKRPDF